MATNEILTITGALGSGKSVVGKSVAARLSAPYFSTGSFQRELAVRRGVTTLELNRLAETEPAIDYEIDALMREFAANHDRCVVDSRLAWHFVPQSFKCYLQVHERIGIERILADTLRKSEKYASAEEACKAIVGRKESEEKRFAALYNLDLGDFNNYDLVVDTSLASPESVAEQIVECFRARLAGLPFEKYWASPRMLVPTRGLECGDDAVLVQAAIADGFYLIVEGHKQVAAALKGGGQLVSFRRVISRAATTPDLVQAWEKAHNFTFFKPSI